MILEFSFIYLQFSKNNKTKLFTYLCIKTFHYIFTQILLEIYLSFILNENLLAICNCRCLSTKARNKAHTYYSFLLIVYTN